MWEWIGPSTKVLSGFWWLSAQDQTKVVSDGRCSMSSAELKVLALAVEVWRGSGLRDKNQAGRCLYGEEPEAVIQMQQRAD